MRIITLALMLTLLAAPAWSSPRCGSSERVGFILIRVGDSERRVLEARPDRTVRLEFREGGAAGFRHEFYRPTDTVQVYVQAGVVTMICRVRG